MIKRQKPDTVQDMREILEGLPCPFCTRDITDEVIQQIIDSVGGCPCPTSIGDPLEDYAYNKACEQWWADLETEARYFNIPYYEDLPEEV